MEKRGLDLLNDSVTLAASVPLGLGVNYLTDKIKGRGSTPAPPAPPVAGADEQQQGE